MKKALAASALALALATGSAFAADLPSRKEPVYIPPPPPMTWTGAYLGLDIGGIWSDNNGGNLNLPYWDPRFAFLGSVTGTPNIFFLPYGNNQGGGAGGVIGGFHDGYNLQLTPSIVVGYESDFAGTSLSSNNNGWNYNFYPSPLLPAGGVLVPVTFYNGGKLDLSYFGTVRGRVGWLFTPALLVYATGGFAYGGVNPFDFSFSRTDTGWTVGGGVEYRFMPNWSAKVEYLHAELSGSSNHGGGWGWGWNIGDRHTLDLNLVRVGVSYHFDWTALLKGPVIASF
ncbi:MAG TPA: outer membrane beta-barrel protein [Methylocystis sp.]|nr:outer membrane beta-barrel protein [Methylocystis sp.]